MKSAFKFFLPERIMPVPIVAGPFRGARIHVNPRHALRQVLGLYEHELNRWVTAVLPRVTTVVDVGANVGYFTLGCAAAFRRLGKAGDLLAFEPAAEPFELLRRGAERLRDRPVRIALHQSAVGATVSSGMTTLDEVARQRGGQAPAEGALVKIDVEGAEAEVLAGASAWLNPTNYFLIEVHWERSLLDAIRETFHRRGLKVTTIEQRALPIIGYEARDRNQ